MHGDLRSDAGREPFDQLRVAAANVKSLIGLLVGRKAIGRGSREQADHGDCADLAGITPQFFAIGVGQQAAEARCGAAGYPRGDPLRRRHVIEHSLRRRRLPVRWQVVAERGDIGRQRRLHRDEIALDVGEAVGSLVEPRDGLAARRFGVEEVVQRQPEACRQLADGHVRAVDQLAPPLGDLALGEGAGLGPAAATDAGCPFVECRVHARLPQRVRRGEAGESRADDRHAAAFSPRSDDRGPRGSGDRERRHR